MSVDTRRGPVTVADPLGLAWDEMARKQRIINEAQAAEAERKDRERRGIARVADTIRDQLTAAEVITGVLGAIEGGRGHRDAMRAVRRVGGRLGPAASITAASANYRANLLGGMPKDEALIRNAGGFVLGNVAGAFEGGVAGLVATRKFNPLAVRTAMVAGQYVGQKAGEHAAADVADGWSGVKRQARDTGTLVTRSLGALSNPNNCVGRGRRY